MRWLLLGALLATAAATLPSAAAAAPPARLAFTFGDKLMTMDADGSHRDTLVARRHLHPERPAWSPDGAKVAFDAAVRNSAPHLYVVAANGSRFRRVTPRGESTEDRSPAWSPDGRRIAFVRLRFRATSIVSEVVTITAGGGDPRVLARRTERAGLNMIVGVAWAPDGRRLLFSDLVANAGHYPTTSLWSVSATGGKRRLLVPHARDATFSPDGARIAYIGRGHLHVMDADGGAKRRLTAGRFHDRSPAWAPDGQRIAFASDRNFPDGEATEIYSTRPDGSCLTWLTNGSPNSSSPAWQPGLGRSSDPGGCGATSRPPIVDVSVKRARTIRGAPVWWLGRVTPERLLLSELVTGGSGSFFAYGDCASYYASDCPRAVGQSSDVTCKRHLPALFDATARRIRRVRGSAIAYTPSEPDALTEVYTGRATVGLDARKPSRVDALAAQLRRLGARRPPHSLAAPVFDRRVWRQLDRARRALHRAGSARRAARWLHKRPWQIRQRVALRRKLLRLGARRGRC